MPYEGTTRVSDAERATMAIARIKGKTARVIAAETGRSPMTVAKQMIDPRTRTLIQELKDKDEPRLRGIWDKTIIGLEQDVQSGRAEVRRDARAQFLRLLTAGDPASLPILPSGAEGKGDVTLEELLVIYRRVSTHGS